MAWWFFGALVHSVKRQLRKARSFEKKQKRRLVEAYTRGRKQRREAKRRDPERERRLLGTHAHEHKKRRAR